MTRIPSYNIALVVSRYNKIMDDLDYMAFLDFTPKGCDFYKFVDSLTNCLPESVPPEAILQSCEGIAGRQLTKTVLSNLAWRMAGNIRRLKNGHPVHEWAGSPKPLWVPVQITKVVRSVSRYGKPGGVFTYRVLAGPPCPKLFDQFWSFNYCRVFAKVLGFSRYRDGPHPLRDVREMSSFRLHVLLKSDTDELKITEIRVTDTFKKWNRRYLERRTRIKEPCPKNHPKSLYCYQCFVGQDQCARSVHSETMKKRLCPLCDKKRYFRLETSKLCDECEFTQKFRKES